MWYEHRRKLQISCGISKKIACNSVWWLRLDAATKKGGPNSKNPIWDYRLITAYSLFVSEFWQNNALTLRFWCINCTNWKVEWIRQASKSNTCIFILSQFSSTKLYTVINLIHKQHKMQLYRNNAHAKHVFRHCQFWLTAACA